MLKNKVLVGKIETSDLIRAIAADDPIRRIPEYKRLLDMTLEEYDAYMESEEFKRDSITE